VKLAKVFRLLTLFFVASAFVNCASDFQSSLESARFNLDKGNYTAAINSATAALQASPGNVEASRLLANAYFGRSGLDFLDLAAGLTDLQNSDTPNFQAIADTLPESVDMDDLRSAITTLETLDGIDDATITDDALADAGFDLAIMQMVESFAVGVFESDYFSTLDVTGILDADAEIVQDDLLLFDNRLIASGIAADEDFIEEVRQTYCVLEPLSVGDGFTTTEYRAFVGCQLSDDPTTFDTTAIDAGIANCDAVNPTTPAVETCSATDTTL
jgi:hypothetical protein